MDPHGRMVCDDMVLHIASACALFQSAAVAVVAVHGIANGVEHVRVRHAEREARGRGEEREAAQHTQNTGAKRE